MESDPKTEMPVAPVEDVPTSAMAAILAEKDSLELQSTRRNLRCREDVYVPLVFHKGRFISFKHKYEVLLDAFRPGVPLAKAAETAGMTEPQAMKFLRRKDIRRYFHDLSKQIAVRRSWPERWWVEVERVWSGEIRPSEEQMQALEWIGDRAAPKPSRNAAPAGPTKIEINIDPGAVDRAIQRQKSIDTQIAQEAA